MGPLIFMLGMQMTCNTKKYISIVSLILVSGMMLYYWYGWDKCKVLSVSMGHGINHIYSLEGPESMGPDTVTWKVDSIHYRFVGDEIKIEARGETIILPRSSINYIKN